MRRNIGACILGCCTSEFCNISVKNWVSRVQICYIFKEQSICFCCLFSIWKRAKQNAKPECLTHLVCLFVLPELENCFGFSFSQHVGELWGWSAAVWAGTGRDVPAATGAGTGSHPELPRGCPWVSAPAPQEQCTQWSVPQKGPRSTKPACVQVFLPCIYAFVSRRFPLLEPS